MSGSSSVRASSIARNQSTHAVRDYVNLQLLVALILPYLIDQGIKSGGTDTVFLSPVIDKSVIAA